ncbi:hypothetical protein ACVVIH_07210 [Chryseobacterium arthrosphaerae]|uniref:hypothetical protein n=1 Tax=Chryseobacterium arthrosphaerae TaxID=651561 RepID=UPI003D348D5A
MIKIPHSSTDLDKMAMVFYRDIEKEMNLRHHLNTWAAGHILKPLMDLILADLLNIIIGKPDQLETIAQTLEPHIQIAKAKYKTGNPTLTDAKINGWFKSEMFKVFNYSSNDDSFIKKDEGAVAYRHAKRLKMNTCPYCNSNFTYTIRNKRMKSRPQFDHFLKKDKYPFFALSFYNLVPSCALCNSGALKGSKLFSHKTHLHPFIESIDQVYQFRTKVTAVDFLVSGADFELKMVLCDKVKPTDSLAQKAKKNLEVFALNDRYRYHKDIAEAVIKNSHIYSNTTISDLYRSFKIGKKHIFSSELEIKELIVGNFLNPDNFHQRIHSKLVRDIADEFGLVV